jgi:hypothetical protein
MSRLSFWLVTLGVVIPFAGSALAQAPVPPQMQGSLRVAVARLDFEGKIPAALQELFSQRLVEGLSAARFEVLRGSDVQLKLTGPNQGLLGCKDLSCYPAMAYALQASYLITAQVAESNKTYTMVLEIINGRTGGVLASNRERCETCGVEEAGEKMGLAASALRERLETVSRAPARFIIRSRPAGAGVLMDGRQAGVTPLDMELPGGPHHLQLVMSGHDSLSRSFTVVSGVDEAMDLDLVAIPSRFPFRRAGWGSVAGGATLLLAGLITMGFDNHEISCGEADKDPNGRCPWVRSTKWWAVTMVGVGAAAATIGGVFLYLAPQPGSTTLGASAGVRGTF